MKLTAVLAKPAPAEASWRVLCSHRSNFESGGVVVGRPAATAGWFEAVINRGGGCTRHSGSRGDVLSPCTPKASRCRHSAWRLRQGRGWPHRIDGDGKGRSRRPDVTAWPCIVTEKAFEGAVGPPSRARRVSEDHVWFEDRWMVASLCDD
jgi:hypothetical protein